MNLGPIVNSSASELAPSLSPDGLLLFFCGDSPGPIRPGGFGNVDMWVTRRASVSEPWGTPVNLGPIVNSPSLDGLPRISPDGSTLYFSSERPGGFGGDWGDIWQAPIIPIVDFNGDGNVDISDLLIMIDKWGTNETLCDIGPTPLGDGVVDVKDLEVLMSYWQQKVEDPTLAAHWKLDGAEGNIAQDSAGEHHGTLNGDPIWRPDGGMVDGALQLDGVDDYVSTDFVLNPADGKFNIYAWIKGGAPGQTIISQVDGVDWLSADPSEGYLMTELKGTGRNAAALLSQTVITDGLWHRIGFVWDGSQRILYVDDVEVARDMDEQSGLEGSEGVLHIGAGKNLEPGSFWSGLIDDVRIYDRQWTLPR